MQSFNSRLKLLLKSKAGQNRLSTSTTLHSKKKEKKKKKKKKERVLHSKPPTENMNDYAHTFNEKFFVLPNNYFLFIG